MFYFETVILTVMNLR